VLDQSPDCIKIISEDGALDFMNRNGQCAMEIDDFGAVAGQHWSSLWPCEAQAEIKKALLSAREGHAAHFQAECPTAKGNPRWWDVSVSRFASDDGQSGFVSISRDITDVVKAKNAAEAIAAEMRHRLGNAYHVVGSLLSSFARGDKERETFANEMLTRLSALAAAQSVHGEKGETRQLHELVDAIVRPYETPSTPIAIGELANCILNQAEVDALAMVLGELCVNSLKHGALQAGGSIHVRAECMDGGARLKWSERSSTPVAGHSREGGKGLQIMRRVLAARGGTIAYNWQPDGVDVEVSFRLSTLMSR
jgi:PAS domain S-box-containing protein